MASAAFTRIARAVAAALLFVAAGCATTSTFETGQAHPSLEIVDNHVRFEGKVVSPFEVPGILEEHGVPHDAVIHIRISEFDRLKDANAFRVLLARAGYSRSVLVTKEHAEAWSKKADERHGQAARQNDAAPARPRIRYRAPDED